MMADLSCSSRSAPASRRPRNGCLPASYAYVRYTLPLHSMNNCPAAQKERSMWRNKLKAAGGAASDAGGGNAGRLTELQHKGDDSSLRGHPPG